MLLPLSDGRQSVLSRRASVSDASYREEADGLNLWGHWVLRGEPRRRSSLRMSTLFKLPTPISTSRARLFPPFIQRPNGGKYAPPSLLIQSDAIAVKTRARRLAQEKTTVAQVAQALYTFVTELPALQGEEKKSDALSVLTARQGGRAGKTRALVALLRSLGIPARIVGGIRLGDTLKKRTTISWAEALLGDVWVPMDPAGGYFAWLPNTYLALYRNDLPLLVHTRQAPVEYAFSIRQLMRSERY